MVRQRRRADATTSLGTVVTAAAWTIIRLSDGEVILTGWGLVLALIIAGAAGR